MNSPKPIILVDGSSFLYRAYHAMPTLTNSKGVHTGAIYGVVNMLRRLLREVQPDCMAVVFDAKGKTFRDEWYPQYKANRPPMPEDLREQIEPLHAIIQALGIPIIVEPGVEADDVIGTLAAQVETLKRATWIVSGDKDLAQLVNQHVLLYDTMKEEKYGPSEIEDKFGVKPAQIVDYLTLVGDTVDNIPGVPKVGPKTAAKWLDMYGDLNAILDSADEIKGQVGNHLRQCREQLPLSKKLVTIVRDLDLEVEVDELHIGDPDERELKNLYQELEFKGWLKELLDREPQSTLAPVYEIVLTESQLNHWIDKLTEAELFAFDTETTSLNYMQAELVGVSFSVEPGVAAYVPLAHDYEGAPPQLDREKVLELLKPLLESESPAKLGQNLKYDMNVLANYDVHLKGIEFDTMLESYVLDSTVTRHDMDSLALKYLGHNCIHFEDIAGKGKNQLTFNQIQIEQAGPYAAEDADITLQLHQVLWPKLSQHDALKTVFIDIEIPLVTVLSRMERNGVLLDADKLKQQSKELSQELEQLEQQAFQEAGRTFNLNSPKQIQEILYKELDLPVLAKTPKGQPSTAEPVLQELAQDYLLPELILQYRSLSKLKSTYTDKLPELVSRDTGRVHTSYHQAVASTGRLSSSDPNLQNIPIRTEAGRRIRQAFVAPAGSQLLAADYSQIELRIMAHLSRDPTLLEAFSLNLDIHRATAAEVFAVDLTDVSDEQRRRAKAINFGLIYGMSAFGLAKQIKVSRAEAQRYIDIYFERYPGVHRYMDETVARAKEEGFVETIFGRRLYLPEINSRNAQRRQYAERTAINAPMQGSAADIIKKAMITSDEIIKKDKYDAKMILQVHDELVFEVKQSALEKMKNNIKDCMEQAVQLDVPLVVNIGMGNNWDEAH
ncbi:MAG TPA: DNA polymerase I [Gammaproteobacteria bacterium]|nr:DNA polymerase I [Gammaproteobacteria bacterium]